MSKCLCLALGMHISSTGGVGGGALLVFLGSARSLKTSQQKGRSWVLGVSDFGVRGGADRTRTLEMLPNVRVEED